MKWFVFISYSHVDSEIVDSLAKRLRQIRVEVFLDRKNIGVGQPITEEVRQALCNCAAVLIVISPASLRSQWVPFEVGYVMGTNAMGDIKKILPVITHPSLPIPPYISDLRRFENVDQVPPYFKSKEWREHLKRLEMLRQSELPKLRREIECLEGWLRLYMPVGREPEDL